MAMVSSCGQMVDSMMECGLMASKKVQAFTAITREKLDMVSGRMEKDKSGSLKTNIRNLLVNIKKTTSDYKINFDMNKHFNLNNNIYI